MASLHGKVVAITDGASGTGLATAKLVASGGAVVSIADINQSALEEVDREIKKNGGRVMITKVNLTKSTEVNSWIEKIVKEFGKLDGAANLAGIVGKGSSANLALRDSTDEEWDNIMDISGKGVFLCILAELRVMHANASIVNASSVAGLQGLPMAGIYVASKHAVSGLTRTAAREEGPRKIRINAIAPGTVKTPLVKQVEDLYKQEMDISAQAFQRQADPLEMANIIAFLLSDAASFVTGAIWSADAGWTC